MTNMAKLKEEYVHYYTDVPVQKYAAMYIGRDEDTIIRWRKEDVKFADAVQRAKAEWVRKRVIATKAEFALERLEKDIFSQKVEVDTNIASNADEGLPSATNPHVNALITNILKQHYKEPVR